MIRSHIKSQKDVITMFSFIGKTDLERLLIESHSKGRCWACDAHYKQGRITHSSSGSVKAQRSVQSRLAQIMNSHEEPHLEATRFYLTPMKAAHICVT